MFPYALVSKNEDHIKSLHFVVTNNELHHWVVQAESNPLNFIIVLNVWLSFSHEKML